MCLHFLTFKNQELEVPHKLKHESQTFGFHDQEKLTQIK